jgi:hypothetical protein
MRGNRNPPTKNQYEAQHWCPRVVINGQDGFRLNPWGFLLWGFLLYVLLGVAGAASAVGFDDIGRSGLGDG